jgi:hypothetical protein
MTDDPTEKSDADSGTESDETESQTTDGTVEPQATVSSNYKVKGEDSLGTGAAILGHNTAITGTAYGVEGATDSTDTDAAGVFGQTQAGDGPIHGVRGVTNSGDGDASGVRGENVNSSDGAGVEGYNLKNRSNRDGFTSPTGAYGECDRNYGYGVVGKSTGSGNTSVGVLGYAETASSAAVWAYNFSNGTKNALAIKASGYQEITQVSVSGYLSSTTSVDSDSQTVIAFDAIEYSDWESEQLDTSTGEFTPPAAGKYHVAASLGWKDNFDSGDTFSLEIHVNGVRKAKNYRAVGATISPNMQVSKTVSLSEGDTVTVEVYHTNGSPRELTVRSDETYVTIDKIG